MFDSNNKPTGIKRIYSAALNSFRAFKWMAINESAFKQELVLLLVCVPLTFFFDVTRLEQLALIISILFILFTEVINTAIEAVVDRVGFEFHELSGLAKDLGSAAVMMSLVFAVLTWGIILYP